jgi:hypothetical protein
MIVAETSNQGAHDASSFVPDADFVRKIRAASSKACRAGKTGLRSIHHIMEVFAVTIFMSLAFAVLFAVLFFAERSQNRDRSLEQDALLPLDDGSPPGAPAKKPLS